MYVSDPRLLASKRVRYSRQPSKAGVCGPEQLGQEGGALDVPLYCDPSPRTVGKFEPRVYRILLYDSASDIGCNVARPLLKGRLQNNSRPTLTRQGRASRAKVIRTSRDATPPLLVRRKEGNMRLYVHRPDYSK